MTEPKNFDKIKSNHNKEINVLDFLQSELTKSMYTDHSHPSVKENIIKEELKLKELIEDINLYGYEFLKLNNRSTKE